MPPQKAGLSQDKLQALAAELVVVVRKYSPEWTSSNESDPGMALLEVFAWLGETLLYRATAIPEPRRRVLIQLLVEFRRP